MQQEDTTSSTTQRTPATTSSWKEDDLGPFFNLSRVKIWFWVIKVKILQSEKSRLAAYQSDYESRGVGVGTVLFKYSSQDDPSQIRQTPVPQDA